MPAETDLAQPLHQVILRGDRFLAAFKQRIDQEIGPEVQEIGHRIARPARRLACRIDHPVRGGAQAPGGIALQHVADVHRQRARRRADRQPAAIAGQQFQPGLLGPQQQGDGVDVLVRGGADCPFRTTLHRRIVQQPQHRIAVAHRILEEVLLLAQIDRNGRKDAPPGPVESEEQVLEHRPEVHRLVRPDIGPHLGGIAMARRKIAPHMPELFQVLHGSALGLLHPERRIATRACLPGAVILPLLIVRQGEEGAHHLLGPVDQALVDPVVLHHGKAEFLERIPQFFGEPRQGPRQADRSYFRSSF
jgi:hypothetical protein